MKYYCECCRCFLDEDMVETHEEYIDGDLVNRFLVCKNCKRPGYLQTAGSCMICGDDVVEGEDLCEDCKGDVRVATFEMINDYIDRVHKRSKGANRDDVERVVLDQIEEGWFK